MIAYLIGTLAEVGLDNLVVEVGHIGYNVRIPANMAAQLPDIGKEIKIYTYTSVRDDAISLFGFLSKEDLSMYRRLIGISGVGPKAGLSILSVLDAQELRRAIFTQDAKKIAKAPGIGGKIAQRIILELKDKLELTDLPTVLPDTVVQRDVSGLDRVRREAVEALTALGYSSSDALRAVKSVEQENMEVEELLKAALKKIF